MRLNTKNADVVRDYYLNLEEAMFAYGEYTMNGSSQFYASNTFKRLKLKGTPLLKK
jgi:hypothetical protein